MAHVPPCIAFSRLVSKIRYLPAFGRCRFLADTGPSLAVGCQFGCQSGSAATSGHHAVSYAPPSFVGSMLMLSRFNSLEMKLSRGLCRTVERIDNLLVGN
jgi:hypothetical protein